MNSFLDTMTDRTTNYIAAGSAALTPWWLPVLQHLSETAALILPVLGVFWLLVQIGTHLWEFIYEKKDNDE